MADICTKGATMGNTTTSSTQELKAFYRLEETVTSDEHLLGYASMICTGDYVFVIGSHYRSGSPDAKDILLPLIESQAIRTIEKHGKDTLPSSCKCHAATGAGRR
jgi:hypothetical protein